MESLFGFVSLWLWVTVDGRFKSIGRTAQGIICFEVSLDRDFGSNNVFVSILVMMKYEVFEGIFENSLCFLVFFFFLLYFFSHG